VESTLPLSTLRNLSYYSYPAYCSWHTTRLATYSILFALSLGIWILFLLLRISRYATIDMRRSHRVGIARPTVYGCAIVSNE
jgi:hypothetical protein